jgi:hypothetical protein
MPLGNDYLATLRLRKTKTKAFYRHQAFGAELAGMLHDTKRTGLYIRLAKEFNEGVLRTLAKGVLSRETVRSPGAYFMRLIQTLRKDAPPKAPAPKAPKKKKQGALFKWKK